SGLGSDGFHGANRWLGLDSGTRERALDRSGRDVQAAPLWPPGSDRRLTDALRSLLDRKVSHFDASRGARSQPPLEPRASGPCADRPESRGLAPGPRRTLLDACVALL